MIEYIAGTLIIIGSFFTLIAAVGIIKFPDIYMRMSATTKTATFGVGLILLSSALYFGSLEIVAKAAVIIIFTIATAPISAHMLGKAAYFNQSPLWEETKINDLEKMFDPKTNTVKSNIDKNEI